MSIMLGWVNWGGQSVVFLLHTADANEGRLKKLYNLLPAMGSS